MDTCYFKDERLNKAVNDLEKIDLEKKNEMNRISGEINRLEALLKKLNLPEYIFLKVSDSCQELIWCPDEKRLLFKIAEGSIRPLIEMPFKVRNIVYESGFLADFFENICKFIKTHPEEG